MFKHYYSLTKPGIIYGNLITVSGGYFLASHGNIDFIKYFFTMLGITLVVASGCVINNIIDKDIDCLMERTKNRVMVQGLIPVKMAYIYGITLGIIGALFLYYGVNKLTLSTALIGWFFYIVVYTLFLKRKSVYGTIVGSISGAIPPVVGYVAVTNRIDLGACILFAILSLWQIPHSYAIAIFRLQDYTNAAINIMPVKNGIYKTKVSMLVYTLLFSIATIMLSLCGYTGSWYLVISTVSCLYWIRLAIVGFYTIDDKMWARKMFVASIIIITILSLMMSIDFSRA